MGLASRCALITDGHFSGGSSGLSIEDGDVIDIDVPARRIALNIDEAILYQRKQSELAFGNKAWTPRNRERAVSFALCAYASFKFFLEPQSNLLTTHIGKSQQLLECTN